MSSQKRSAKDDRRLGLLGEAASKSEEIDGSCPSSQELAVLIEQQKELPKEYQHLLTHIASCHSCYQEWLVLSRGYGVRSNARSIIVKLFSTPRYLAATGSAMAIAASVIVFFAIPQQKVAELSQPQKLESMAYSLEDSVAPMYEAEELGALQVKKREEAPMTVPSEDNSQRSVQDDTEKELIARMTTLSKRKATAPAPSIPEMKGAVSSGNVVLGKADSDTLSSELTIVSTYKEFEDYLLLSCKNENYTVQNIEKSQKIAERIMSQSIDIDDADYKKLESIISLTKQRPSLDYKQFCEQAAEIMK